MLSRPLCFMPNRFGFPQRGFGLGLRADHYDTVLTAMHAGQPPLVDWLEIISENFMEAHKGYWEFLSDIRQHYPIVMHGVSMSIGSTDALDMGYLKKLKALADFLQPPWLSDHLCWTGVQGRNTHDLLPVPYTEASLAHIVSRVKQVQDVLQRPLVLENPSSYLEFDESTIPEWEFMVRIAEQADCALLLDVNNVYVSAFNHGYDPKAYIDAIPADRIAQIHLAGHLNLKTHIIDTHDHHVIPEVWELYAYTLRSKGMIPTMVEWDDHIPPFDVLQAEVGKARQLAQESLRQVA
jgi:uncharacterized protein